MPSKKTKAKAELIGMPWDFASLWNEAIRSLPERPLQKRDHIWASELGGAYIDRYLKMHGHPYSNPINFRSKRKFTAGHIWEWIVGIVLTATGIIRAQQLRGEVQLPKLLKVTGRLDFIAGGDIDWVKAKENVQVMQQIFSTSVDDMPPFIKHAVDRILFKMEQMFTRVPLKEIILECKSVGGIMAGRLENATKAMAHHELQNLHYLIANKMKHGAVLYVSKDDAFCYQFDVEPTKELLKKYRDDVKTMTAYYRSSGKDYLKTLPPLEKEVSFNEVSFQFVKNFYVEYSNYITFLYGYKDFEEFKYKWQRPLAAWNRVFKRCVRQDNMTPANLDIIIEAKKTFPDWDKYVSKAKAAGAFQKEGEDE